MEKRLFLAAALAILVTLGWSTLVSKLYHIDNKGVTEKVPAPAISAPLKTPGPTLTPQILPTALIKFPQEKFEVSFQEAQAAIKEIIFKEYQDYKFVLKQGLLLGDENLVFQTEEIGSDRLSFVYQDKGKRITKRFIFAKSNYSIELELEVANLSSLPLKINLPLILGVLDFTQDPVNSRFQDVTAALKERTLHLNARKDISFSQVRFLGLRDRYFCAIIEPEAGDFTGFIRKINPQETEVSLSSGELLLSPGQQIGQKFQIYLGPQDLNLINRIKPAWSAVMYYGIFDLIAQALWQILEFLYRLVHSWGTTIIIVSLGIYFLLYPLTAKQMRAMKQMQTLQPQVEEIRRLYKDNPQRLNKEIMELYRKNKVNPFGGCLPLVLQIPIFFALYQVLMRSVALKGAKFLWIKDLSIPDRLFILPVSLPILGNEINILPILMSIGMFIQQRISLKTSASGSAEQQRLMLILLPVLFAIIFYHLPAGLVLYWLINSALVGIYQFRMSRKK